ncbi:F-box only protein 22 [Elysia marginata]|uniref:F-box only protein 22 n=1 Tax=Elysia marginata TaxID=1093978 RepID=A0AAV4I2S3_9GAST|nr:F-box only protein 22 [Elysia marginata]
MASHNDEYVASGSKKNMKKSCNTDLCGDVLTNVIVVVEKIFKCLNARQLNNCARVCKVWNYQAKREKESREWMRWNFFSSDHFEAGDFDAQEWWLQVKSFILDGPIEPGFLLMFCSDALCCHLSEVKHKKRKKNKEANSDMLGLLEPILPPQCSFQIVMSDGVVGTDSKMKTEELEEYELALSLIMFGKDTLNQPAFDLEIMPFTFSYDQCRHLNKFWSDGSNVPPSFMQNMLLKKVKMVNLFSYITGIDQEVGYSFFRMLQCPLVAGGYVNSKVQRDDAGKVSSSNGKSILAGFALCGKNVEVASVLIKSGVDTEEEVDQVVKSLKDHNLNLNHSFGLMYACVGRGANVYECRNVESSVFRRHFPRTPLLGFFGNGEIGCNYPTLALPFSANKDEQDGSEISGDGQEQPRTQRKTLRSSSVNKVVEASDLKHPPKLLHAYTTVLCLVSITAL